MLIDDLRPPVPYPQPWPPIRWWPPIEPYAVDGARSWWGAPYAALDGWRELQADVHVPASATPPVPVIVWIHGGWFDRGTRWRIPLEWPQRALFDKLIAAGLAVAAVDYRHRAEWPDPVAAVRDVRAAIRYVRHYASVFGIDPHRVGVWGESAGGFLAAFAGLTGDGPGLVPALDCLGDEGVTDRPSAVQAVADWYGVHDLGALLSDADVAASGYARAQLAAASPLAHVPADGSDLPPFLLMHGLADTVVPFDQSDRLHAALVEAGASSTLIGIPGADHVFNGTDVVPLMDQTIAWLAEVLA